MKKMLLKLSSALLVVAVAGSCAFAQGQSNTYEPSKALTLKSAGTAKAVEAEVEKVDTEKDIYRTPSATTEQDVKSVDKAGNPIERPIVKKRTNAVQSTTPVERKVAAPKAVKQVPANTTKATAAVAETTAVEVVTKERVNNTVNALPADYKAPSNETKPNK